MYTFILLTILLLGTLGVGYGAYTAVRELRYKK